MRLQTVLFVLFALLLASTVTFLARLALGRMGAESERVVVREKAETIEVLVADAAIGPGVFLKPDSLRWQPWPIQAVSAGLITRAEMSDQDLSAAVARQPIAPDEPITEGKIVRPGSGGFLAAVLQPGRRAVSILVTRASGNAGLVFPGDFVDLVLTQRLPSGEGGAERVVGETVLRAVRVLAIDQLMDRPDAPKVVQTVTLELTPEQAQHLAVAQQLGDLALSLRSLAVADSETGAPDAAPAMTWDRDVSQARGRLPGPASHAGAAPPPGPAVVIMRGQSRARMSMPATPSPEG
jgi:pilus assembly protein CpaB